MDYNGDCLFYHHTKRERLIVLSERVSPQNSLLVLKNIFFDIFNPVATQRFQDFIKSAGFRFSGDDDSGIFQTLSVSLNIVIELFNGFNGKGLIVKICVYDGSRRNDEVMMYGVVLNGLRCVGFLCKATVYSADTNG